MKRIRLFIIFLGFSAASLAFSQISHGGTPYFLQPSMLRTASKPFFVEMPAFDLDSVLLENEINAGTLKGSNRFAHKFYTHIDSEDAVSTILPDGTIVKQIGIRSQGAYSINLLLNDFEIPPGGKLFIYSANHSHVVGSFDDRNNSPEKILPIQPVAGESIIVEYSEPPNTPFTGRFIITEVNHDYRDVLRTEPKPDLGNFACMPDVYCTDVAEETIRATVLLIIDGTSLCTGSLLNNTSDDGKPYLLTAVHCLVEKLNRPFPVDKDSYIDMASTIITFFNYNRPVCSANIKMKGSEEMSLAGAFPLVIASKKDIALLELKESPPDYYNAYFAGWNRNSNGQGTFTNLHHPNGAVKKYGMTNGAINVDSYATNYFDTYSHWKVPSWTVGSTHEGSSGSPLFDQNQLIIGGLSAGESRCIGTTSNRKSDYFFMLNKAWETGDSTNQLKTYLDPLNKEVMQYQGKDPNETNPVFRLANALYANGDNLITSELEFPDKGFVFGNSNLSTIEFAEEFNIANDVEIFGTYLLIPSIPYSYTSGVTVSVYTGDSSPETKIYSTSFVPKFLNYSDFSDDFELDPKKMDAAPTETFVVFDNPVSITTRKFFISYTIGNSTNAEFCVYNTEWADPLHKNTAWLKEETKGWIPADAYEIQSRKTLPATSLAIQPLVRNKKNNQIEKISLPKNTGFYYERSGRVLTLKEPLGITGQISIFSIGGQLLEKIWIRPEQTTYILKNQPKGTVCIVKITSAYSIYTGKIMY